MFKRIDKLQRCHINEYSQVFLSVALKYAQKNITSTHTIHNKKVTLTKNWQPQCL